MECPLTRLPPELLLQVFQLVPPHDHLTIALASREFYNYCSRIILSKHRTAHDRYRVTSDLSPILIPTLLRRSLIRNIDAWHVHELELWGSRVTWNDWVPYDLLGCDTQASYPTEWKLSDAEISSYLDLAGQWWDIPVIDLKAISNEFELGGDGFFKLLVMATCPRLRSVKFVKHGADQHTSLQWLTKAIGWSNETGRWPPGFLSISDAAVGVCAGSHLDQELVERRPFELATLLRLPNIENVYFRDLHQRTLDDHNDQGSLKYGLRPRRSPVKHLFLDHMHNMTSEFRRTLVEAPAGLVSITLRGRSDGAVIHDMDQLISGLSSSSSTTLSQISVYNPQGLHGYSTDLYFPSDLNKFKALKHLSISIGDMELQHTIDTGISADTFNFLETVFPPDIEIIEFWGEVEKWLGFHGGSADMSPLDAIISDIIQCGRYKNLRAVYLDCVERVTLVDSEKLRFRKAIEAGRRANVHVHTITNRDDSGVGAHFPAAPDRYDLKTLSLGKRPGSWKVNRLTGDLDGSDCGGCGICVDCARFYPETEWKSVMARKK